MRRINETLITNLRNYITQRCYYTNRVNKETLYTRISPLGNPNLDLTPELDNWIQKGNKVRFAELQRIVLDLRRRKRYSQALQVSEWMNTRRVCVFTPTERAIQLDLIGKVHGFVNAERYFMSLNDQDKTDKTYGALLHCYVRQRQTDKALSHLQKMKDSGVALSPLTYNDIMSLFSSAGQHEKTYEVLTEMKKDGITPDIFTYKICINSFGVMSDIEGMERILKEMESQPHISMDWVAYATVGNHYITAGLKDKANIALKKAEAFLDNKNGIGHNYLITLHARLGNTSDVFRMWDLMKSACKRCVNKDYIVMLDTLAKLGEFTKAEELIEEWEASGNCYDFRVQDALIIGYSNVRLYDKARGMLEKLMDKQRTTTPGSWERVAVGFVENDEIEKALYCFKAAHSLHAESKRWKPNNKYITILMNALGEKGSAEDVESFVALLRNVVPVNRQMYHALMKAYIRDGKAVDGLLNRMKADTIPENEETEKIKNMEQEDQKKLQNNQRSVPFFILESIHGFFEEGASSHCDAHIESSKSDNSILNSDAESSDDEEVNTVDNLDEDDIIISNKANAMVFDAPDGSKIWTLICDDNYKPQTNQHFPIIYVAFLFYREYGRQCGFDVRKSTEKSDRRGNIRAKYIQCSRGGSPTKNRAKLIEDFVIEGSQTNRKTTSRRCNCKAQIVMKPAGSRGFVVMSFVEEHNHPLAIGSDKMFLRCNRDVSIAYQNFIMDCSRENLCPTKAYTLAKEMVGSYEDLGATVLDFKNFSMDVRLRIGDHDTNMILTKFKLKKEKSNNSFYYDYKIDRKGHLTGLFWTDVIGQANYEVFGDMISFDPIFRTNRYAMVFVPFTGVDNHWKNITFASALLAKENYKNFKWLINTFKLAMGCLPSCMITDQCPAIKNVIALHWSSVKHRLCMWHIMNKLPAKIGPTLASNKKFMDRLKSVVYSDNYTPTEFEER